jgi:hypothetical protein
MLLTPSQGDWEDLSRGLTWSETEVSQGERQRLIAYRCTGADRARAMLECVRYLEKLMPVPKKNSLAEYRERYSSGYNIESIMSSHVEKKILLTCQKIKNSIFSVMKKWTVETST